MGVTIREVAREAGVSVSTASYALRDQPGRTISEPTRERVFVPRGAWSIIIMPSPRTCGAADHAPSRFQIGSLHVPILATKVAVMERRLREAGLYPLLCHTLDRDAEQRFYEECASRRVCGVILATEPHPDSRPLVAQLMAEGVVGGRLGGDHGTRGAM